MPSSILQYTAYRDFKRAIALSRNVKTIQLDTWCALNKLSYYTEYLTVLSFSNSATSHELMKQKMMNTQCTIGG